MLLKNQTKIFCRPASIHYTTFHDLVPTLTMHVLRLIIFLMAAISTFIVSLSRGTCLIRIPNNCAPVIEKQDVSLFHMRVCINVKI